MGLGDLAGKAGIPEAVEPARTELRVHVLHHARGGDEPGVREVLKERRGAEEVIAVGVGDEDRGEVLAGGGHPGGQGPGLFDGHQGVDKHRVALAVDQGGGGG